MIIFVENYIKLTLDTDLIITKCNISIELINVENSVENVQNFAPNGYIYYVFYVENLKYADVSTFYT